MYETLNDYLINYLVKLWGQSIPQMYMYVLFLYVSFMDSLFLNLLLLFICGGIFVLVSIFYESNACASSLI